MERNGFNPSSFETSGDKSDDSKEKSKSKKKKSAETSNDRASESKKEAVADRTKALLDKFLGDNKIEKVEKTDEKLTSEKEEADDMELQESDAEDGAEEETDLELLTPEEDAEITRQLVDEKLAELEVGRSEQETPEDAAGREAAIAMLEQLRDETIDVEPAMDESAPEIAEDSTHDAVENIDVPVELDDEQTVPLNKNAPKTLSPSSGSGQGGVIVPPRTVSGATPLPPAAGGNFGAPNANSAPVTASEKTEYQPDYRVNPNATYLLVGGIVGYLIGRRRGRIKTEKRMNVVIKKLEKQVEAKQQEINEKTETVQKLARQNYEQTRSAGKTVAARSAERVPSFSERSQPSHEQSPAAAHQERARAEQPLADPERQDSVVEKGIELSDADISRLSETITIGATNLRKIYEAKLITDGGLRRLVNEHLQGKDIRRGLAREFLTKELSYERDPRFRDIVPLEANGQRPQGGGAASQPDVQPVALATSGIAASMPLRPTGIRKPIPVKQKRSAVSTGLLTVLSFVALALAVYAVWLGLMR